MEEYNFNVNLGGMLDLLSNHLYSTPKVFLRELLQNSVDAINLMRNENTLTEEPRIDIIVKENKSITFKDNGCGMSEEQVKKVVDPFFTTRTTRKIGLGIPFFKMTAEMTGGSWTEISYEQLLAMNPQVLVIPAEAAYTAQDVLGDPELAALDAVKNGRVYAMPTAFEAWDSPVPSGVLGALWLASELHPEAYAREQYVSAATELYETYYGFTPDEAAL